jgi:hypothetical protein
MNTNPIPTESELNIKLDRIEDLVDHFNLDALLLLASQEVTYGKD